MTQLATAPGTLPTRSNGDVKVGTVKNLFEAARSKIEQVAPKHLSADRLMRVALMTISRTPKLAECTPHSLLNAFMTASQLGLEVGGVLGEAYLVPYGKEATFLVGYRGLINLARRSGQIISIEAQVVRQGDLFDFEYGLEMRFRHQPKAEVDAPITHAWALARFRDGGHQLDVMTIRDVEAIRKRSRSATNGPWVTDFAEMAKKTVVRRLCKYLPLSPEVADAIDTSDKSEFGDIVEGSIAHRAGDAKRPFGPQVIEQHPTDEARTVDRETSQLSSTEAEDIINKAPRAAENQEEQQQDDTREVDTGGIESESPTPDLSAFELFQEAMTSLAAGNVEPKLFDAGMVKVVTNYPVKRPTSGGVDARKTVYTAAAAGQLDWAEGKIVK